MACNICRAPILVEERFVDEHDRDRCTQTDHLEPIVKKVCPELHRPYFRQVVLLDRRSEGIVVPDVLHAGRGLFIGHLWDIEGGMALAVNQEDVASHGHTVHSVYSSSDHKD